VPTFGAVDFAADAKSRLVLWQEHKVNATKIGKKRSIAGKTLSRALIRFRFDASPSGIAGRVQRMKSGDLQTKIT
jgi:hypothetical protein